MVEVLILFALLFIAEWWIRAEARRDLRKTLGNHTRRER